MSQREWLQEFDAIALPAFQTAGIGDLAILQRKAGGGPVNCTVLVDLNVERYGVDSQVVTVPALITCMRSEVTGEPLRGDTFDILNSAGAVSEFYTVETLDRSDESVFVMRCRVDS